MPSDLAKKKAAKKKEAAKARQRVKKHDDVNGEEELQDGQGNGAETNGETNGGVFIKIMPKVWRGQTFWQFTTHKAESDKFTCKHTCGFSYDA